jgi:hypothetical protein
MNTTQGTQDIYPLNDFFSIENLRKYFETFGEVADCVLMMDRTTGKSGPSMESNNLRQVPRFRLRDHEEPK